MGSESDKKSIKECKICDLECVHNFTKDCIPLLVFCTSSKAELSNLLIGMKKDQITKKNIKKLNIDQKLISELKQNPGIKNKVRAIIRIQLEHDEAKIQKTLSFIKSKWANVESEFWKRCIEVFGQKVLQEKYFVYPSIIHPNAGHNVSKNYITINQELKNISNYIIAHEITHILFKKFLKINNIKAYNKNMDEKIMEILTSYVLFGDTQLKSMFEVKPSMKLLHPTYRNKAKELYPNFRNNTLLDFLNQYYKYE